MSSTSIILVTKILMTLGAKLVALSITELVSVAKSNLMSHALPISIKLRSIALLHLPEHVVLLGVLTYSLLDNFTALTIEHPLMSHLLVASCRIVVHLVAFVDTFSVLTSGSLRFGLVHFAHWLSIRSNLCSVRV